MKRSEVNKIISICLKPSVYHWFYGQKGVINLKS